jgi:hypothetical protein
MRNSSSKTIVAGVAALAMAAAVTLPASPASAAWGNNWHGGGGWHGGGWQGGGWRGGGWRGGWGGWRGGYGYGGWGYPGYGWGTAVALGASYPYWGGYYGYPYYGYPYYGYRYRCWRYGRRVC